MSKSAHATRRDPAGPTRGYLRPVRAVQTTDGLALRVFGDVACRMRREIEPVLDTLLAECDPEELTPGERVATLRLVPRHGIVEFVTDAEWRAVP